MHKRMLGKNVLDAARERVARVFDDFPRVLVSFSGGKDSSVMTHLVAEEAIRRGRKFGTRNSNRGFNRSVSTSICRVDWGYGLASCAVCTLTN
jgi:asparagine synthetase B (glutamine-hydrolysing)